MLRLDLHDGRLLVHSARGPRALTAEEADQVRDALPAPDISVWRAVGSVVVGILAMAVLGMGGGA